MLGSDYPFPLGEQIVGNLVKTACVDRVITDVEVSHDMDKQNSAY